MNVISSRRSISTWKYGPNQFKLNLLKMLLSLIAESPSLVITDSVLRSSGVGVEVYILICTCIVSNSVRAFL